MATVAVRLAAAAAMTAVLAGCGLLAGCATSGHDKPASAGPAYNVSKLLDPASGKFLGVEANGAPASLAPVRTFAAAASRKPDMIGEYISWKTSFDAQAVKKAWSYGALSYLVWEPYGTTVAAIAAGHSNAYITRFAVAVRALNLPVAISFGHEMNGYWYPWGTKGTTPAEFVAAWRLIHGLFAGAGATNVIWIWNPNDIYGVPNVQLKPYWPGNAYVNWVGITGYFYPTGPRNFATLFRPTMQEVSQFTDKPFFIAETSVQTGPVDVTCLNSLLHGMIRHNDVLGLMWFNYDKQGIDWRVQSRPSLRAAFDRDVAGLHVVDARK
jgi:mannan endo-1,4-beta-mannosidase